MSLLTTERARIPVTDSQCENQQPDLSNLTESIERNGYAHIKEPISFGEFEHLSEQLGAIVYRTDLQITKGRKSVVYNPEGIEFHMDNPNVHIIGWYCIKQDETDGSSLLIDTADIAQHFSLKELAVMETINVKCPHPLLHDPDAGKEVFFLSQLLFWRGSVPQVYFARWLLLDSYDEKQIIVLNKFRNYLQQKQERELIKVRLNEKESLFINNRRLLHGRGQIGPNSSRLIKRVWITEPQDKW